jgi:diguanylate cyclase (GGDEF)-like protein/PAS domain S-box-containing protein
MKKNMSKQVLIITANTADASTLKSVLAKAQDGPYRIKCVKILADGIKQLDGGGIDVVLADMTLPDSKGIATFDALFAASPQTPIMTLSAEHEEPLAITAVEHGSQGYLTKGHFGSYLVPQSLRNIIHRKAVEEAVYIEKERAEITLNSISDGVIGTDMAGNIAYLNIMAEKMTGWSRDDANGHPLSKIMQLINATTRKAEPDVIKLVLKQNKPLALTAGAMLLVRGDGEAAIEYSAAPIHDSRHRITGVVIVFRDITAAQVMATKMAFLAQHDFLTGLPNRVLLNDRIAQAIYLAERRKTHLAVLFLDLDNFKHINDSLGHETGDKLLQSVTQRLNACVRSSDTVSRQGGDEFVILLTQDKYAEDAAVTANKILDALALPHAIAKHQLHVTTSIGISVYPVDAADAETLIKNADTAMYHAKEHGRNNYQFFKNEMNVRAVERQGIEADLRHALQRKQLVLHYQPKVNLASGEITGAEALLRWSHAEKGLLLPQRFIPVAEDCGLIVPIGRWVLREACAQAKRWQDAGLKPGLIAVNISALEFRNKDFVATVHTILQETKLKPDCLQLEITESVLMRDAESSAAILQQLKDMGIELAVDNFGTGYSSLSYLNQFPIDVFNIDQSFVHHIGTTKENNSKNSDGIIVSAVIAMGNSLKQRVVAEGVDNQVQLAFLKSQHCVEGQGYIFSRPLDAGQYAELLATGIPRVATRVTSLATRRKSPGRRSNTTDDARKSSSS